MSEKCVHGRYPLYCKECGSPGSCEHKNNRNICRVCSPETFCEHGRNRYYCKDCGYVRLYVRREIKRCVHGRNAHFCQACGGKGSCEHKNNKHHCHECNGAVFCEHGKQKSLCKECGGVGICVHSLQKSHCRQCKGLPEVVDYLWRSAHYRAGKKKLPFSITREFISQQIQSSDWKCPVFGVPYDLTGTRCNQVEYAPTLDRFDGSLGYTEENTFVISKLANMIKTHADYLQVQKVADWMKHVTEEHHQA